MKYALYIPILLIFCTRVTAQDNFLKAVKNYYRVDPFAGSFSAFVKALTTDTALHNKVILKQTDSTGFYVKGSYDIFNPYSINANKVEMIFYENETQKYNGKIVKYYVYQLLTYFPDTEVNRNIIKKDYARLVKMIRSDFHIVEKKSLKGYQQVEDGEISSLTYNQNIIKPAIVSWQTLSNSKQLVLAFIINIRQIDNRSHPANVGSVIYNTEL